MVAPLAVDLLLLRTALASEVKITPGRAIMARVAHADGNGRGSIRHRRRTVRGELPSRSRPGLRYGFIVRDVCRMGRYLQLSDPTAAAFAPPPAAVPLPGGGALKVVEREQRRGGSDPPTAATCSPCVTTHHTSDRWSSGSTCGPGPCTSPKRLTPGEPLRRAQADAVSLREALQKELDRPISVELKPGYEPLDVYAETDRREAPARDRPALRAR